MSDSARPCRFQHGCQNTSGMTEESREPNAISPQCLEPGGAIRHSPALFGKGQGDMKGDRVYLFDTTLRDGAQTQGVDFGVADKVAIAEALDRKSTRLNSSH